MQEIDHDADGKHVGHQVARGKTQVRQVMQGHFSEVYFTLSQEKVVEVLLQRLSKHEQSKEIQLLIQGGERHVDKPGHNGNIFIGASKVPR